MRVSVVSVAALKRRPGALASTAARGFTLLEVLIALAILALSSLAIISQVGQTTAQLQHLEQKQIALSLAQNQINRLRMAEQWPATGRSSERVELFAQRWEIQTEVSDTLDPQLRKITVAVLGEADQYGHPVLEISAYRGQF